MLVPSRLASQIEEPSAQYSPPGNGPAANSAPGRLLSAATPRGRAPAPRRRSPCPLACDMSSPYQPVRPGDQNKVTDAASPPRAGSSPAEPDVAAAPLAIKPLGPEGCPESSRRLTRPPAPAMRPLAAHGPVLIADCVPAADRPGKQCASCRTLSSVRHDSIASATGLPIRSAGPRAVITSAPRRWNPVTAGQAASQTVYSCIAALEVNGLNCRGQGRTLRIRQNHCRAPWSVAARELLPAEGRG